MLTTNVHICYSLDPGRAGGYAPGIRAASENQAIVYSHVHYLHFCFEEAFTKKALFKCLFTILKCLFMISKWLLSVLWEGELQQND